MLAFGAAVALGYRHVETDVHATADGVVVAVHDPTLDRVTDRVGRIADLPWSEVSRARIGGTEPVPTLADLLHTWPDLRINIDLKAPGAVLPTVAVIEAARAWDRVCVTSFSDRRRRGALSRLSAPVATSAGTGTVARFLTAVAAGSRAGVTRALRGVHGLQVPERAGAIRVVTPRTLAAAHANGVQVHVWTVNDQGDMERLLDLGVDGLVTDRADLLRGVLGRRGAW